MIELMHNEKTERGIKMDLTSYCNIHLDKHNPPIFVADIKTDEILYLNSTMKGLLGEKQDVIGKVFHKIIANRINDLGERKSGDWNMAEMAETEIFNQDLNMRFHVQHIPFEFRGTMYNLCKYIAMNTTDSSKISYNEAMSRCAWILQSKKVDKISQLMSLLGEYYEADRAYYYEVNRKAECIEYKNMWFSEGKIDQDSVLEAELDFTTIDGWLDARNEVGFVEVDSRFKTDRLNAEQVALLKRGDVDNIVVSMSEDKTTGFMQVVGISNRKALGLDFRFLRIVTRLVERRDKTEEMRSTFQHVQKVDILTGFYRKNSYLQKLETYRKKTPQKLGVIFVNINGMKQTNRMYGYAQGDIRIKKIAERLRSHFKTEFYRVSGDEFVAFFDDIEQSEFEINVYTLRKGMKLNGDESFTLGRIWRKGRYNLMQMVEDARSRMYINKQEYYAHVDCSIDELADKELGELLNRLTNGEFMVYLQPQMFMSDKSLFGAEALIRGYDKVEQKLIFPNQFIPEYEKKSIIRHIDMFVIDQVCQLLAEWGTLNKQIPISVNLSRVTLLEFDIVNTIAKICDSYDVPRELVVIEVTERMGLVTNDVDASLVTEFKDKGFRISLDDFGCAYSNIVTLAQVAVDEVKIDKSLVDHIVTDKKNAIIVKHILAMCNELNQVNTLAEGIELQEQADCLHEFQCHIGQGYLYSRPIPVTEFFEKYIQ